VPLFVTGKNRPKLFEIRMQGETLRNPALMGWPP